MTAEYLRILISATSQEEALHIIQGLSESRLIAGGLVSQGLSRYWWEGSIVEKLYYNVSAFTVGAHKDEIVRKVESMHEDDTPIIAFFKIDHGNEKFLDWIKSNTI